MHEGFRFVFRMKQYNKTPPTTTAIEITASDVVYRNEK